jgi:catecholate siderophore receptor
MTGYPTTRPALWLALALLLPIELYGQVRGVVLDPARTPIVDASVAASGATTRSGEHGEFSLDLAQGRYRIQVTAPGFQPASLDVQVPAGSLEVVLQVAGRHETVTVIEPPSYSAAATRSSTRTLTDLRDVPQSVTVVPRELMADQLMRSIGDVMRYVPGITSIQGENNRDQVVIRGNSSSADFYRDGVRDDVQYYRDLYNVDSVEALKGPNAMAFGRGGGGGAINRVSKEAGFTPLHEFTLVGGSYRNRRIAGDWNQPLNDKIAFRLNGVYENSDSFRDFVNLERYGVNPELTIAASPATRVTISYEHFHDGRTADRGVPSFQGRPLNTSASTYFGNPDDSHVFADVNIGTVAIEHQIGRLNIRNRTLEGDYDRGYQNYVPGAVTADRSQFALSAYNNATHRRNLFNQTDFTYQRSTGALHHTLLAGVEAGHQFTENFRNTGYFNNTATSVLLPVQNPVTAIPTLFRQSATDADNHVTTNVAAVYVQDQVEVTRWLQIIAGARAERFDLTYHNRRTGDKLGRADTMVSPRAGVVFKPVAHLSAYASYSVSHLPSSGDQFSSLTTVTEQVKPERFTNYETGIKWDVRKNLALTAAVYRLDRTNTRSTDPNDPTRIVQTGSQRTNGVEIGWNGSVTRNWRMAGGYAWQNAFVTSATTSARAGAHVAQVPHRTFSFWNHYQLLPRLGAGLGLLNRSEMYAAIEDTVTLPGYVRADAAVYYSVTEHTRLQVNIENLTGRKYFLNADSNNNISPGSPRAVRAGLTVRF